ncbi:MAG TPA: tRNA uridine(34) 5-carboxymethylaminomethyl modification radical SAM/GNAT enzyme Elp3 [Thermoplasmata archaeon]|nr:tRNA uridine(34) 5-carboxymethylaminomethyl modification radical SAM/GNAT enzyme Elp3 [Thermoplasmata archaeon]
MSGPLADPLVHREAEKRAWARASGRPGVPSNVEWREQLDPDSRQRLGVQIARRPTRTLSGVAVVAVMTAPTRCPHGTCTYCPGGIEARSPQSYTGEEPSALRGAQFGFDARAITEHRLAALEGIGHPTSKVEVIVMGGTFPSRPPSFQREVFHKIFDGLNGEDSGDLESAQLRNESAERRCVGLTVETRPDWCDARVLPFLLKAGVTRIEIGVECLRDPVLASVGRAHGVAEVVTATRAAKDSGLKVGYHMMLGLPGMDPEADAAGFERLFADPAFRPDFLKIYPTLVLPGTPLFAEWQAGRYAPYDAAVAAELLARIKPKLPPWVRIHRIQRDIPARLIAAGVRSGNLRQQALALLAERGQRCPCLRCREVGRRASPEASALVPLEREYEASGARELFLSYEEPESEAVGAYLRLRLPFGDSELAGRGAIVRELKVLGPEVGVGRAANISELQHRGLGRALLERAAERAREAGATQLYVTSAVGTREYYRRRGFERAGPYQRLPLPNGP